MAKEIVFLGMGGTIAGTALRAGDNVGYTAAQVGVQHLLASVPGLQEVLGSYQPHSEQVCQIDSKDLAHTDWRNLLDRLVHHLFKPDVGGVVVTHGTDTLEETAYFLHRTLPAALLAQKPVVLTCAMRPASSLAPDGPGNIADAAAIAVHGDAHGVLVVCAGKIHAAQQVQKVHPYRLDAFDSGEVGPIGVVEEGRVRLLSCWPLPDTAQAPSCLGTLEPQNWPRVELLVSHAGASGAVVRALLADINGSAPLRGLVVAGTGNGTVHQEMEVALLEAMAQGVRVQRVSRCAYGQVVGGEGGAQRSGAFTAVGLSAVKARIALMLEIASATT
jgi:L-asparaginase